MCKQSADTDILEAYTYGHACTSNTLAMPVYVMSTLD